MIRKATNDLTIKPKLSTTTKMAAAVCVLFVMIVGMYFSYSTGVKSGHSRFEQDKASLVQLTQSRDQLRTDLAKSQESLIFAQRQKQIQEEAYKQLSKAYANSEQKNRVLGSRLDFYRSIISPEDGQSGPAIQSLTSNYDNNQLSFDVTLVQAIKHKHQVRGNLRVSLYNGEQLLNQWPNSSSRSINYQYFQQVSGSIESPLLTDDARIKVELILQEGDSLERWFEL